MNVGFDASKRLKRAWMRLKKLAKANGYAMTRLAEEAGISTSAVCKAMRDSDNPNVLGRDNQIFMFKACARTLGVPLGEILDNPAPTEVHRLEMDPTFILTQHMDDPMLAVEAIMPFLTAEQRTEIYREVYSRIEYGIDAENRRYFGGEPDIGSVDSGGEADATA